ncbi:MULTISPECIES: GTP-binding protein [unclassified Knoellia]|uniref:GTP-binding protein n=1 Tax=Knoellia altitudinis TaxID=3404795 RepID=UPI003605B5B9
MSHLPVFLVAGLAEAPMSAAALGLQCDLPGSVLLRHDIHVEQRTLTRTIADLSGILEREVIDVEHLCVACAVREDIVPTLERLAALGRWEAVVTHLPLAADPTQVCRVVEPDHGRSRGFRVAGVVVGLEGESVRADLVGDDLLSERGLATSVGDRRGVAEVTSSLIEYADVVTVFGESDGVDLGLVDALSRPGAMVLTDWPGLHARDLLHGIHDHAASEAWVDEVRRDAVPQPRTPGVWTLDLVSDRPLHPDRLQAEIAALATGGHRSRGCFHLPSRPGAVCGWSGAGDALSIGTVGEWGGEQPITRIVVHGLVDEGSLTAGSAVAARKDVIQRAFESALLTDDELTSAAFLELRSDGLETWLGPIDAAA